MPIPEYVCVSVLIIIITNIIIIDLVGDFVAVCLAGTGHVARKFSVFFESGSVFYCASDIVSAYALTKNKR